jgi:bacteriorhodopsin
MELSTVSLGQYNLIYNAFSFTFATMAAATLFFWLNRGQVAAAYRPAITITGLVTFIAAYHYLQIFLSWEQAFDPTGETLSTTGYAFNEAYRYVDWLLTVPLLLIELILVMNLGRSETVSRSVRLGLAAAIMVILGYPGEVSADAGTRWLFWVLAMIPFLYIVYELFVGLSNAIAKQPENARGLVNAARWLTVLAWGFYPIVFIFPMIGFTGGVAVTIVQVGYSIADIVAKAVFGVVIYMIAVRKSEALRDTDAQAAADQSAHSA